MGLSQSQLVCKGGKCDLLNVLLFAITRPLIPAYTAECVRGDLKLMPINENKNTLHSLDDATDVQKCNSGETT